MGLIGSLVVIMFVFWWTGTLSSRLLSENYVFKNLQERAANLVSVIDIASTVNTPLSLGQYKLDPAYDRPASGRYFVVLTESTRLESRSSWEQNFQIPQLASGEQQRRKFVGVAGEPLLFWLGGFARQGQHFTVAVGENFQPIRGTLRAFHWFSGVVTLVLLLALVGVQRLIVKRSVDKLEAVREDMLRLEHGRTVALSEDVPSEIQPLVKEFNRLLRRFNQRLRQSRNSVGNLAHSLKGPLNLLLRASESDHIGSEQKIEIAQNAERIHQLIESELKRARLAGRGGAGHLFDINAELPVLIGLLSQVYSDKQVDVRYAVGPGVELTYDRQDMLELIGNLLDNAVKWSQSVVMVNLRGAKGILIEVEDDGPGCSDEELDRLIDRGVRLDESVIGHGLGLSIVKDIIDSYEGRLELTRSARLGGLCARVYLPTRARDSA